MASAARKMSGPTKIVELDGVPVGKWKIDPNAVHLWKGKLWRKEKVGCVLCCDKEGNEHITLTHTAEDGKEHCHCMEHGELMSVPYSMKKVYTINIGGIERVGEETLDDTMLFPAEMTEGQRTDLINSLLDEAQKDEAESGPAPSEDDE